MTNVRSWNDRLRSELRKQWWQTLTVLLALGLGAGLWIVLSGGDESAGAAAGCATNGAVTNASRNPGLVADCETLLALKAELSGGASLNWSASTPMQNWKGVYAIGGRVSYVLLSNAKLAGTIPAGLGDLPALRYLDLRGNQLTGAIPGELGGLAQLVGLRLANNKLSGDVPAELGNLEKLSVVELSGNSGLTGCVPPSLRKVYRNDMAALGLADCSATPATATPAATATATPKTYTLTLKTPTNGSLEASPSGGSHAEGTSVTVTATAAQGYKLTAWGDDCAGTEASSATCTVVMNAARTVSATFGALPVTTYTLTLTQAANGTLTAVPSGPYTSVTNTVVTITATPDHGYELTSWGGDCAGTAATEPCNLDMNANRGATGTFAKKKPPAVSGPLTLIVISDGSHDRLQLEWTGGPSNVESWVYRKTHWNQETYQREPWERWHNLPAGGLVTGLKAYTGYFFEIRPVVNGRVGAASNVALGATHYADSRAPEIDPDMIVEGDGTTQWRVHALNWVITIPDGMRVRGGRGWIGEGGPNGVSLYDVESGSGISFDDWGFELGRTIRQGSGQSAELNPNRDVGALFDQIAASVKRK